MQTPQQPPSYKLEGDIDFFAELYKSLDDHCEVAQGLCLISNTLLTANFVEMKCGHKFNYEPLYYDLKNHKQKFNTMESAKGRLNYNEIRCPYCRIKYIGALPYYEELGLAKVHGVNYLNPNFNPLSPYKKCGFIHTEVNKESGVTVTHNCSNMGSQLNYCGGTFEGENYGDEKYYCWTHKKQMIRKYKKDTTQAALQKEREEKKKAKELEKQKALEKKHKAKEDKKKAIELEKQNKSKESAALTEEQNTLCCQILKYGSNKGQTCGNKLFENGKCKRHCQKESNNSQEIS